MNKHTQSKPTQIFILGAYGQNNLGDEALLQVFIDQFHDSQLVVNSAQPEATKQRYGVKTVRTYWGFPRFSRLRAILKSDWIVFGGGSLLKEIEGNAIARLMYFARILLVLLCAKLTKRHTVMLGVGMGPLHYPLYKTLSRVSANLTDLICVRDTASRDLLVSIGVKRKVYVTADPVFTISHLKATNQVVDEAPVSDRPFVVAIPRYSLTPRQRTAFAAACDHLIEAHQVDVLFIPFQTAYHGKFDDGEAIQDIRAQMKHHAASKIMITDDVQTILGVFEQAQLVLSARLHGLIFAARLNVASVALNYEVKISSFMDEIGQPDACLDLPELEAGHLPAVLDRVWEHRAEIASAVQSRVEPIKEKAQSNFELMHQSNEVGSGSGMLSAGAILFVSMTVVNAGNYLFNLILGRKLGPANFADLSLIVTLMLVVTFITTTLQTTTAKFSAMYAAQNDLVRLAGLRRWVSRSGIVAGVVLFGIFGLGSPIWMDFFHTQSIWPFIILGLGLPIFLVQAVDRGVLQGQTHFKLLAATYQAEMWTRLILGVIFVTIGWSVNGAVGAISLSFVATWLVASRAGKGLPVTVALSTPERNAIIAFSIPVIVGLIGQILINNSDILIVKRFFPAEVAGQYAALALIGRIVFFATWSIVTTMFPIVAQKHQKGQPHRYLLGVSIGIVAFISTGIILATLIIPDFIVGILFGAAYLSIAPLLWVYAVATALYALANVIVSYRLSAGSGNGNILVALAGAAQVIGLWVFHDNLAQVVWVQVIIMAGLLSALLLWDARLFLIERQQKHSPIAVSP